ncbi:outer membrane beta-barrel protein [Hyunsoonleella sp. SJ7]|uniref:Outer membrane beta-barrel protein n=1 Tax=Hyunsoonleella aquatilis TaxID=2762758 RepID=A0A923KJL2_9FLAO|nr:outer membrane beta-barrel protein [Hyunsoonleella aquatilis]MBC3757537.1 outer membrane beta-barrel protein [Hyunsoonleella aquatilis]
MKKHLLFAFVFLFSVALYGQQLYMEYGSTISSFDYKNSQGQRLNNLLSRSKSYFGMGYRHTLNGAKTLFLNAGLSYNNYGAIGSESRVDNYFEWDVSYLGANAGLDLKLFQLRDLIFYANGSAALEFMVRGNQTINNDVFNLVGEDEFNNNILFLRVGVLMQYPISSSTAIYVGYKYGSSVLINSGESEEKLKLNAHQFGIGFIINLPNCYCDF